MAVANLLAYNLIVIRINCLGHGRVQKFGIGNPVKPLLKQAVQYRFRIWKT